MYKNARLIYCSELLKSSDHICIVLKCAIAAEKMKTTSGTEVKQEEKEDTVKCGIEEIVEEVVLPQDSTTN